MYERFGLFVAGEWRQAANGAKAAVISPVTEASLGEAPVASVADTEEALHAAEAGLKAWRATPAFTRADAMHAIADEMVRRAGEAARMISSETGKPIAQAQREWGLTVDQFRWYAEEARRIYGRIVESRVPGGRFEVSHEPVGVAAAFTAWNFPAALIARKVAPCARCRLLGHRPPLVAYAGHGDGDRRLLSRRKSAARRREPRRRPDGCDLRTDHGVQGGAQSLVDRLDARWPADDPRCRRHDEEGIDGARRQRAADRLRGRRSGSGAECRRSDQIRERRPGLRDAGPLLRAREPARRVRGGLRVRARRRSNSATASTPRSAWDR